MAGKIESIAAQATSPTDSGEPEIGPPSTVLERVEEAPPSSVLLVDDEPLQLRALTRLLDSRGYRVVSTRDARAALEAFREGSFDVVLSDISMPEMDGLELLKRLKEDNGEVPVVLMTGEPAVSTAVSAIELGAFRYLTKPVAPGRLEEVIDRAIDLRRNGPRTKDPSPPLDALSSPAPLASLGQSFDRALASLWLAYQPIVRASSGEVYGYEALLRSSEPSLPHPGAVIGAAEQLNRLDLLGRRIRDKAALDIKQAQRECMLFVNVHTTDLLDPTLTSPESALAQIAHHVVLEVTERASLHQVKDVRARVGALREIGFRIAVDDLGAGYAGLTSFALLEPEIVKLDMTLVRDIQTSVTKQRLVRSMTRLSQEMGLLVVGEGVETAAERATLQELGCDLLQGYLFAKPNYPFPEVSW